jgi:hypothetical protein
MATDGLLEMVPLTHEEHRKVHEGDPWTIQFLEANATAYFKRIYLSYHGGNNYLGPMERVAEIRKLVLADVARRREAFGKN